MAPDEGSSQGSWQSGSQSERTWRIGEVAAATGLTVRALHHYDEIGMVVPSERTASGHRLYTARDLTVLYRVTAMRQSGIPLTAIGDALTSPTDSGDVLRDVIDQQLEQVERQIRAAERLRERLLAARDEGGFDSGDWYAEIIKLMRQLPGHLSPEEIDRMSRRMGELGVVGSHAVGVEMPRLYGEAMTEMRIGTPASDPVVRRIADRLDQLAEVLRGPEPDGTGDRVRGMWVDLGGPEWGELVAYLDEARTS
jgi:MerR family transcriptional regulator, thiopeptide resistance regulator